MEGEVEVGRACDSISGPQSRPVADMYPSCFPPPPPYFLRENPPPITGLPHDSALFKGAAREKLTLCDSSHPRLLRASPRGQHGQLPGHTLLPGLYQPAEKGEACPLGTKMGRHPARVLRPAET